MARRLTRSTRNSILGGVAAGFGDYLEVDPVLIRLIFILLFLAGGSGLILYLVCWLIMPRDEVDMGEEVPGAGFPAADQFAAEVKQAGERVVDNFRRSASEPGRGRMVAGAILIGLGALFLLDRFVPVWWLGFSSLWPLVLIAAGVFILLRSRGRGQQAPGAGAAGDAAPMGGPPPGSPSGAPGNPPAAPGGSPAAPGSSSSAPGGSPAAPGSPPPAAGSDKPEQS